MSSRPQPGGERGARLPVHHPGEAAQGALPGGAAPSPPPNPPRQHSEYSSVGFSHLGRGTGAGVQGQGRGAPQSSASRLRG